MRIKLAARLVAVLTMTIVVGHRMPSALLAAMQPSSYRLSVEQGVAQDAPMVLTVPATTEARLRSVLIAIEGPGRIPPGLAIEAGVEHVAASSGSRSSVSKSLHLGDPDVTWILRQDVGESMRITVALPPRREAKAAAATLRVAVRVADLGGADETAKLARAIPVPLDRVAFETEPNDTPESANRLILGQTVYGLADDRPYLPLGEPPTDEEHSPGVDWFTFTFESESPKLAFFALDFVDRDVPPDVRIYQKRDGRSSSTPEGIDPQSLQRERPPRPGANKFTTRVLTQGTYFVWVDACQPEYQLRTKLFDVPPYLKPEQAEQADPETIAAAARKAIRTAMDFQLLAGDSWHANTPRKGHPIDRVANFHHETSTCVACHPTHFTTQSALAAVKAGYERRAALRPPVPDRAAGEQPGAVPRPSRGPLGPDDPRAGERPGPALDHRHGLREPGRRLAPRQSASGHRRVPQALLRRPDRAAARRVQRQQSGQPLQGRHR